MKIPALNPGRHRFDAEQRCPWHCAVAGRRCCECFLLYCAFPQGGGSDTERTKKKRRGDRYSVQTSLIVAALKKMLPIGLNMCSPADQELINLAKIRYSLVAFFSFLLTF